MDRPWHSGLGNNSATPDHGRDGAFHLGPPLGWDGVLPPTRSSKKVTTHGKPRSLETFHNDLVSAKAQRAATEEIMPVGGLTDFARLGAFDTR